MKCLSGRGTTRAEDAQGTPSQSHVSPSILVYEDKRWFHLQVPCQDTEGAISSVHFLKVVVKGRASTSLWHKLDLTPNRSLTSIRSGSI